MAEAAAPRWNITQQQEAREQMANGQFVNGMRVYFTTQFGVNGSIFVPNTQYKPDMVRNLIEARVQSIEQVHGLRG